MAYPSLDDFFKFLVNFFKFFCELFQVFGELFQVFGELFQNNGNYIIASYYILKSGNFLDRLLSQILACNQNISYYLIQ